MALDPTPNDPFDPNTWNNDAHEYRIHASNGEEHEFARVDAEDYSWAVRHGKWHINKPHPNRKGKKRYFRSRAGWRIGGGVYLHVAIMNRMGVKPPTRAHTMVDHVDGNELNCRRKNLEWVTPLENALRTLKRLRRKWRTYARV